MSLFIYYKPNKIQVKMPVTDSCQAFLSRQAKQFPDIKGEVIEWRDYFYFFLYNTFGIKVSTLTAIYDKGVLYSEEIDTQCLPAGLYKGYFLLPITYPQKGILVKIVEVGNCDDL